MYLQVELGGLGLDKVLFVGLDGGLRDYVGG